MLFTTRLFSDILLLLSLAAIYLGFAGFLGSLLYQFRSRLHWTLQGLVLFFTLLTFVGTALLPPWSNPLMRAQLLAGYLVVLVFSLRPIGRPDWMWKSALAFRYLSLTLVLVVLWSLTDLNSERLVLAPWAALAAVLAWQRGNQAGTTRSKSTHTAVEARQQSASSPGSAAQGRRKV